MNFVVGIDVGGHKKGYHAAFYHLEEKKLLSLIHIKTVAEIIRQIDETSRNFQLNCSAIGIDSPAQSFLISNQNRQAEKELVTAGYRIIWTPKNQTKTYNWMEQGAALWKQLKQKYPHTSIIETFPTAIQNNLVETTAALPLNILHGKDKRKFTQDYIDAFLCALACEQFLLHKSRVYGLDDSLNPIHSIKMTVRKFCLAIVTKDNQILLGMKKKGFGKDKWNGFGGKIEPGETEKKAALRELKEECFLTAKKIEKTALIHFTFTNYDFTFEVHVYRVADFSGTPAESDEMIPQWFDYSAIPYHLMWKDDRFWLPLVLAGKKITAQFHFADEETIMSYSVSERDKL
ncbi:MAG: DUF429 domain-containing protein [Spirochaetes bacterium]|nr:DUF429 domain-containing protein [Spirochaetota bacterium]